MLGEKEKFEEQARFPYASCNDILTMYDALLSTINAPERSEYASGLSHGVETESRVTSSLLLLRLCQGEVKDLPESIQEVGLALWIENHLKVLGNVAEG